jgi:hypothetical protein
MHHAAVRDLHVRMLRNGPDGGHTNSTASQLVEVVVSAVCEVCRQRFFGCCLMLWGCLLDCMRLIRWFVAWGSFCKQQANTALHGADGQYGCLRPLAYLLV